jgi:hypothetical protein
MPVYEETAAPNYELLEDYTTLPAEVTEIEERETPFKDDDGNPQRSLSFTFRVSEGEHQGRKFWGNTPTFWNSSDRCKLRQWAQSIANRTYAPGEPLNTDILLNRPCRIVLGVKKKQNGDKTNRVVDVLPDKSAAPAGPAPTYDEPF